MRNSGVKDILVTEILLVFATGLVAARLNLRLRIQKRKLLYSDKFMVAACISGIVTAGFVPAFAALDAFDPKVHTTLEGYSRGVEDLRVILMLLFASNFPFYTTFYLCKAALLAVYLQAFPDFMVKRRMFLWLTIWFVGISYVVTLLVIFCICVPFDRHWDLNPSRTCSARTYVVTFNIGWGLSFLGDLLVFILPWLIVPAMNVRRSLRIGIYFTFLVGSVNMAVSLVRFVMIWKAGADSTISLSTIILWSSLDVNIGLVIACLPSLRPYFGSRDKPEGPGREVPCKEPSGKRWTFGGRAAQLHGKQHDEEGSPSCSTGSNVTGSVVWAELEPWEDGRGNNTDASEIELVQARLPAVEDKGKGEWDTEVKVHIQ